GGWEGMSGGRDQWGLRRRRAASRECERGDVAGGRAAKRIGRKHHHEIDAKALPVEGTQVGDACRDVAAEHVDGDRIAHLELEAFGDLLLERNERRALVCRRPPFALRPTAPRRDRLPTG